MNPRFLFQIYAHAYGTGLRGLDDELFGSIRPFVFRRVLRKLAQSVSDESLIVTYSHVAQIHRETVSRR